MKTLKIDNIINIPTNINKLFDLWVEFLSPFHTLTPIQKKLLVSILRYNYELSKEVTDHNVRCSIIFSVEGRERLLKECEITKGHYSFLMSILRKKNVIVNYNIINTKYIPKFQKDKQDYQLLIRFDLSDEKS